MKRQDYLKGKPICPAPITTETTLEELVEQMFIAYNSARLREASQLLGLSYVDFQNDVLLNPKHDFADGGRLTADVIASICNKGLAES